MTTSEVNRDSAIMLGLRASLAHGLVLTGVSALTRKRHKNRLRILMYHGVLPQVHGPAAFGNLFITAAAFARQMRYLKRAFRVMSLDEVIQAIEMGSGFPDRAVAITFDDGYRNTVTVALRILQALQLPATVFVAADRADSGEFLWFDALRVLIPACVAKGRVVDLGCGISIDRRVIKDQEGTFMDLARQIMSLTPDSHQAVVEKVIALCREDHLFEQHPEFALAGWDEWRHAVANSMITVGSHGLSHGNLLHMSSEERLNDLRQSKLRVERELSRQCRAVAYPYGTWDDDVARAANMAGYACAVTADDGLNGSDCNRFALRRTMVGDKGNFYLFCARVSGLWGKLRAVARCICGFTNPLR